MTTDKMREDFEAWFLTDMQPRLMGNPTMVEALTWQAWQAATTESTAKIAQMQTELEGVAEDLQTYFQITKDLTSENVEFCNKIEQQTIVINELVEALNEAIYSNSTDIAHKKTSEALANKDVK